MDESGGNEKKAQEPSEVCDRCNGTGLICGHIPVIGPGSCCVDYMNAVCPNAVNFSPIETVYPWNP